MKEIILDCSTIGDKAALHAALKEAFAFPDWYGNNLDALHDCLTDICQDTELILQGWNFLDDRLGPYAASLVYVLHVCSEENPHLHVTLN